MAARIAASPDLLMWSGWTLTYLVLYSVLGGILHFYYLSTLAPALAALAGIGAVAGWRAWRTGRAVGWLLPLALPVTAAWQWHAQHTGLAAPAGLSISPAYPWPQWLLAATGSIATAAAVGLVIARLAGSRAAGTRSGTAPVRSAMAPKPVAMAPARSPAVLAAAGLAGLLLLPFAWAASSVLTPGPGIAPSADLYRLIAATGDDAARLDIWRARSREQFARLTGFLRGRQAGERFLLATSTTEVAAPLILATGQPVMARGGFSGTDPALTPQALQTEVAAGRLRFALLGDLSPVFRRLGAEQAGAAVEAWVRQNGRPVDPATWRGGLRHSRAELFDLAYPE